MKLFDKQISPIYLVLISFVTGGLLTYFIMPEKITIKKEIQVVEKEVEKVRTVEKEVEVVKYVEKVVTQKIRSVKRKETFPDGHIIEEELFESESEQVDRIRKEEKERYTELVKEKEKEFEQKISSLKIHTNPKRFILHAGVEADLEVPFIRPSYTAGMTAGFWGPFTVTGLVTTNKTASFLLGIKF